MFFDIARRNARRSRRRYLIHFVTLVVAIVAFVIILALDSQEVIRFLRSFEGDAVQRLLRMLPLVYIFSLAVVFFLIHQANRYQYARRQREFGLYLLHGMPRPRVYAMLLLEGAITGLLALAIALPLGIVACDLLDLLTTRLAGQGILEHRFHLPLRALILASLGYLGIQLLSNFLLVADLMRRDLASLLRPSPVAAQRQAARRFALLSVVAGLALIGVAWALSWRGLDFFGARRSLFFLSGAGGVYLLTRGLGQVLPSQLLGGRGAGLGAFTARQLRELLTARPGRTALLALVMLMGITGVISGLTLRQSRGLVSSQPVYDFSLRIREDTDRAAIDRRLAEADIAELIAPPEDFRILQLREGLGIDLAAFRQAVERSTALSAGEREKVVQDTSIFLREYAFALSLSTANQLLAAAGEEAMALPEGALGLYINDTFFPHAAHWRAVLASDAGIRVGEQAYRLAPRMLSQRLVADQSITISMALILPDALAAQLTVPRADFIQLRIGEAAREAHGHLVAIERVDRALRVAGIEHDTALQGFARSLFYRVAGSYSLSYLGFLFMLVAVASLSLDFLSRVRAQRQRYIRLAELGADAAQMRSSLRRQQLAVYGLPLGVAGINAVAGVRAVIVTSLRGAAIDLGFVLPLLIASALTLLVIGLYAWRTARNLDRLIEGIVPIGSREIHLIEAALD